MQIGAVWCRFGQLSATRGNLVQTSAVCCSAVVWCNFVHTGATWCNLVQTAAVCCILV